MAVPLFIDHFSNARKAEYFGIATVLDHQTMNAEELFEAIQLVMNEPRYFQKNIATLVWIQISTLFLSMNKMPALGITFLVVSLAQRTFLMLFYFTLTTTKILVLPRKPRHIFLGFK